MVDYVLVSWTALRESVQLVHVVHIPPEERKVLRYVEIDEIFRRDADMLKTWHQFTVEAAHRVACQETGIPLSQMIIDPSQVSQKLGALVLVFFH